MTDAFPEGMDFGDYNAPSRVECNIYDFEVGGTVPAEIDGTWFRLTPDPQYPPMPGKDTSISGGGTMSYFRFNDGHVDFRIRYVMTERLRNDLAARRSLYGACRNPYTDDPVVRGNERGATSTTPIWHGGKLLALKKDSRAVEPDPHMLDTIGVHLPPLEKTHPDDPNGPDELLSEISKSWPDTLVVPFHYPHPVTGKMWTEDASR
jgi:carotenoid cleavage dioxygenase